MYRGVTHDGTLAWVILPALLIGIAEGPVLGRVDLAPRVARDPPAVRSLVLERVEVLRLAREQVEDHGVLEESAGVSFAHEFLQVGGEERAEDRVGPRLGERLDHRPGVDLSERWRLLNDELDAGLGLRQ